MLCKGNTVAQKRYQADVLRLMGLYVVVLFGASWIVRHHALPQAWLYFWSVLPAIPVIAVVFRVGRYLREETDEFQKLMMMQQILIGAGALVVTVLVNDFLRAFANAGALEPFWGFIIFAGGMALTGAVQKFRNRVKDDD